MIMRIVSRQYFQAMGMRIIEGRTFSEVGRAAYPELIVNQEFVRRYFPGTNPIGQLVGDQTHDRVGRCSERREARQPHGRRSS